MAWNFEVKDDEGGQPRWWLYGDGTLKALSGESFYDPANAERAAREFKASAAMDNYRVWQTGLLWYWDAISPANAKKVATGGRGYPTQADAHRAADGVRRHAAGATGP